jgi:hypothetical protein
MRYAKYYRSIRNIWSIYFQPWKNFILRMQFAQIYTLRMEPVCSFETVCQTTLPWQPQLLLFRSCPFVRQRSFVLLICFRSSIWFHFRIKIFINQSDGFLNHTSSRCWSCSVHIRISELYELVSRISSSSYFLHLISCVIELLYVIWSADFVQIKPQTKR